MTEQTEKTKEQEKSAQMKRVIGVLVFGTLGLMIFFYMANGVTSLLTDSAMMEPVEVTEPSGQ